MLQAVLAAGTDLFLLTKSSTSSVKRLCMQSLGSIFLIKFVSNRILCGVLAQTLVTV